MIFFPVLLICSFLALLLQMLLPPLADLHGARIVLMPVIMFYGTLALPWGGAMLLTFCCGLMWDLLTLQVIDSKVEISVGWSIIVYSILGSMMHGFRPLFLNGRREIHWLLTGVFTSVILLSEYFVLAFRRHAWALPDNLWWQIAGSGLVAAVLAPLIFWILGQLSTLLRCEPGGLLAK